MTIKQRHLKTYCHECLRWLDDHEIYAGDEFIEAHCQKCAEMVLSRRNDPLKHLLRNERTTE